MPKITIDSNLCKGCGLCIDACPKEIIVIGDSSNDQGYFTAVNSNNPDKCTGCALCAEICPDIAIKVFK